MRHHTNLQTLIGIVNVNLESDSDSRVTRLGMLHARASMAGVLTWNMIRVDRRMARVWSTRA